VRNSRLQEMIQSGALYGWGVARVLWFGSYLIQGPNDPELIYFAITICCHERKFKAEIDWILLEC